MSGQRTTVIDCIEKFKEDYTYSIMAETPNSPWEDIAFLKEIVEEFFDNVEKVKENE